MTLSHARWGSTPITHPTKEIFRKQLGPHLEGKDRRAAPLAAGQETSLHLHEDLPTPAICDTVILFLLKARLICSHHHQYPSVKPFY